jgi:proton glutamate symport protein
MMALIKKYAEQPWVIFFGVILGILAGMFLPGYAEVYTSISHFYLALLEMCVLPVMTTAVISSLGHLIHNGQTIFYVKRIVVVFIISLLSASLLAILFTTLMNPGRHLSDAALDAISKAILGAQDVVANAGSDQPLSLWQFFTNLVPNNVFGALATGKNISVLFVSILVGIAIGVQRTDAAKVTLNVLHSIFLAFIRIIGWIMMALPIGLFFLFASYFAQAGSSILGALAWLISVILSCGILMMVIFTIIIRYRTGYPMLKVISMLRQPLMLAFFTSSSLATMPATLKVLQQNFKLNENLTALVIPLGTSFNQQASVIRYTCVAIFVAQMYGVHLGVTDLPLLIITSIMAAMAGSGLPGIAAITMSAFVLQPLGLPVVVGIILLTIIEPIIDPVTTMVNVFGNCMATTLVIKKGDTLKKEKRLTRKEKAGFLGAFE